MEEKIFHLLSFKIRIKKTFKFIRAKWNITNTYIDCAAINYSIIRIRMVKSGNARYLRNDAVKNAYAGLKTLSPMSLFQKFHNASYVIQSRSSKKKGSDPFPICFK